MYIKKIIAIKYITIYIFIYIFMLHKFKKRTNATILQKNICYIFEINIMNEHI